MSGQCPLTVWLASTNTQHLAGVQKNLYSQSTELNKCATGVSGQCPQKMAVVHKHSATSWCSESCTVTELVQSQKLYSQLTEQNKCATGVSGQCPQTQSSQMAVVHKHSATSWCSESCTVTELVQSQKLYSQLTEQNRCATCVSGQCPQTQSYHLAGIHKHSASSWCSNSYTVKELVQSMHRAKQVCHRHV